MWYAIGYDGYFLHAGAPLRKLRLLLTLRCSGVTTAKVMLQILSIVEELLYRIPHCTFTATLLQYILSYSLIAIVNKYCGVFV